MATLLSLPAGNTLQLVCKNCEIISPLAKANSFVSITKEKKISFILHLVHDLKHESPVHYP